MANLTRSRPDRIFQDLIRSRGIRMQRAARSSRVHHPIGPHYAKILLEYLARRLRSGDHACTVDRLFESRHVEDLRLIVASALNAVALVFAICVVLAFGKVVATDHLSLETVINLVTSMGGRFLTFFGPVLAVFGAVLAWAYQVGSARLGVVDLFACEISTLCRVATIVDTVGRYVDKFDTATLSEEVGTGNSQAPKRQFTAQENYFPVFEGNIRDLQTLEARVVVNITEFYTYMKVVRDSLRTLAGIEPPPAVSEASNTVPAADPWHAAVRNVVYMLFLSLESARHAITDLVEFEPEYAERTIVILISELEAYRFLRAQYKDKKEDMHYQRIELRALEYEALVPGLCHSVEKHSEKNLTWEPARRLVPELRRRFHAAMAS